MTRVTGVWGAHQPHGGPQGARDFLAGLYEGSVGLALQKQRRAVGVS